ncbi:MAG: C25 family cysteine peptidase [Candidatus Krumholzibacteria bacterium]|nr:C25 family cysteine peptidase [Candidatus Krumholzibacteria bacterium]
MTTRALARVGLAVFLLAGNARAGLLTKQISFEKPGVARVPGGVLLTIPGCRSIASPGEPILPVYPACFIIPPGETVSRIIIEPIDTMTIEGSLDVAPMQPQAPLGTAAPSGFVRNAAIYRSSQAFPAARGVLATEQTIAGVRLAFVNVYPCVLIPSAGTVLFSSSVRVTIETVPSAAAAADAPSARTRAALRALRNRVENPGLSIAYAPPISSLADTVAPGEIVHYVIITSPTFVPSFQPLVDLKARCGMRARIVDTAWIAANYGGADLQEKIRNFVRFAYENWQTTYVLLGGDDEVIPHRGFYVKVGMTVDADIASDLYYSCLDGNWNTDGDQYFGEPGEEDLLSEVIVGRLPVDSPGEIANAINKISSYTFTPIPAQCTSVGLFGELLWSVDGVKTWGGDYKNEILYGSSSWGFTTAGIPPGFSTQVLYDSEAGSWNVNDVLPILNGGINLVNHCGHSNLYSVMRLAAGDVGSLTNDGVSAGFFVCYSQGCYAASFDNRDEAGTIRADDCIAEELVTDAHGAVAFIGNTRLGWDAPGSTCGVSQFFDRRFFDAIFGEGITRLGDALEDSRIDNVSYIGYDAVRWVYYEMCVLGDPALSVWTDTPRALAAEHDSVIFAGQGGFEIRVSDDDGPLQGALASLNSTSPDAYCAAVTDASGTALLTPCPIEGEKVLLSVVSRNHYPHADTITVTQLAEYLPSVALLAVSDDTAGGAGDGDGLAEAGETAALTIALGNIGSNPLTNVAITLAVGDTTVTVLSGSVFAGDLPPGTNTALDRAFSIEIGACARGSGVTTLEFSVAAGEGTWKIPLALPVSAPDVALESFALSDAAYGNGNGCLEAWEFQNLSCVYRNRGTNDAISPVLTLSFPDNSFGRAIKASVEVPLIPAGSAVSFPEELLWFVNEATPPFSEIAMILTIEGRNMESRAETVRVRTCGYGLDDPADEEGSFTHGAIVGVDQWHVSTERYHSAPSSWRCGNSSAGTYANIMESVLSLPPLCLFSNSRLTFWHRMNAEAGTAYPYWALDAGVVELSQNGGATWKIISPTVIYPSRASPYNSIFLAAYQRCYSGAFDWKMETFDLSTYHGPALIRFHFASDEQYGFEGWYVDDVVVTTDVPTDAEGFETPSARGVNRLEPAYPNPFNPRAIIPFELAARGEVEMKIFDVSGRLVRTLVERVYERGRHAAIWDGKDNRGAAVASGIYFCRFRTGVYTATTRLALVR